MCFKRHGLWEGELLYCTVADSGIEGGSFLPSSDSDLLDSLGWLGEDERVRRVSSKEPMKIEDGPARWSTSSMYDVRVC